MFKSSEEGQGILFTNPMSKSKSEKGLQREFQKLSNKMLTFFILICLFLIILTYISFAQFYTQTKDLNSKYSAKVMLNDIQYKPSIQPIIQIKVFGGYNDYYFKIVDTGKTYYSSEPGREFIKSLLL